MAGTKRFAAKLVIWTSVLATGGAGAWYATEHGVWPGIWNRHPEGASAKLIADDPSQLSTTDLDAIASGWAADSRSHPAEPESSSPLARSADVTLANAAVPPAEPPVAKRYGLSQATSTPEDLGAAPSSLTEVDEAATPTPVVAAPIASADENVTSGDEPDHRFSEETSEPTPALARGQDPDDGGSIAASDGQDAEAIVATPAEPKSLQLPDDAAEVGGVQRARQAFGESPAFKASSTTGGRYASAPSSTAASPPRVTNATDGNSLINPFASQPTPTPTSSATASPRGLIEALPEAGAALGNDSRAPTDGLTKTSSAATAPSARAAFGGGVADVQNSGGDLKPYTGAANNGAADLPGGSENAGSRPLPTGSDGTGKPGERALEGPQKPALTIQKISPTELQVGKPSKLLVQVRNVGSQAAENVTLRDEVPLGTRLVSTSPTAESNGSHLVWQLGKLSIGEERTVEMQVMPTTEGEIGSVATVTYTAQASVKARCTMPQLALRLTAPNEVMIGGEQRVKIELRNPGTGDAAGVMLFENVPQNLKHSAGPALEFEIGTLRAGETRELELVLLAEKAGKVVNVLTARAEGNLQVQQQVEFEVIAPALSVEVNGPERRYLERPATYEVVVANPGTAAAHDVQLVTKLPKGMRFVRANNMGEYDAATHAVYWSLAELPEGERGAVELVAMPIETGPQTLEVESRAQQGLSDQKQQQIMVEGLAAIMFEVRDMDDPIEVGGETGYEIRVVNQGTKAATNVRVAINLPPGMQLISAEGETRHAAQGGSIVFDPLAQLAPKADTVYRLKVQGLQAGDQRVTVEVNTDDLGQPIRREESTRVFGDE